MAGSRRIEADVVVKVTGAEDVEEVAEAVRELSDTTTNVRVDVENEDEVEDVARAFEELENVTVTATARVAGQANIDDFIRNVRGFDNETATAILAVRAAQAEQQLEDIVITLGRIESSPAEIALATERLPQAKADLEALHTEIVRINGETVSPNVDPGPLRNLGTEATNVRDGLGTAFGEGIAQLGELNGALGPVANQLGNVAEQGIASGASLASMAAVAAPLAAVSVAIAGIKAGLDSMAKIDAFKDEQIESWVTAIQEGEDAVAALSDRLREAGEVGVAEEGLFGNSWFGRVVDAKYAIANAGLSFDRFSEIVASGQRGIEAWADGALASGRSADDVRWAVEAMNQELVAQADAANEAAGMLQLTERSARAVSSTMADFVEAEDPVKAFPEDFAKVADALDSVRRGGLATQDQTDALNRIIRETGLTAEEVYGLAAEELERVADATDEARERQRGLVDAVGAVNEAFEGTSEILDAAGRALERFASGSDLDFAAMASDTVESFDALKAALEEVEDVGSRPLAPTTVEDLRGLSDESAKVIDALGGMRDAIQTELVAALGEGGGNLDAFRQKAAFFRGEVETQFRDLFLGMGLSAEEADTKVTEVLGNLGLLPSQVETQIRLTQAEEALRKIELFGSAIDDLPTDVQAKVAAAIDENDPVRAWELIRAGVDAQGPVPVGTTADTSGATGAIAEAFSDPFSTTIVAGSDTEPAREGIGDVEDASHETTIDVDADTAVAAAILFAFLARPRIAEIYASLPNIGLVNGVLNLVASPREAPIDAYVRSVPSASSIANRIGTVRVPVDAYVRTRPRVSGSLLVD